jgi:hypothetical protein
MQRRGAYFSGVPVKGAKTFRQQGFGISKLCGEGRGHNPTKPIARTMLHQDLSIFPGPKHPVVPQGVPVGHFVNGAVDLAI